MFGVERVILDLCTRPTKNISRGIFGPIVFGVTAAELFADGWVGVLPEAGEVVGDLLTTLVGC